MAFSQTKTTEDLHKRFEDNSSVYFLYRSTLKMLNQTDSKEFDELIKDIEKMKFLLINKTEAAFTNIDYRKLIEGYKSESYEEMATSRFQGRDFGVYIKDRKGDVKGTVILVNDSSSLYVLDIVGKIAVNKATELIRAFDDNADFAEKIKDFMSEDHGKGKDEKDDHHKDK